MELDAETDSEFWTSLNLISTQPDEEIVFSDAFTSYLRKSPTGSAASCKVLETKSLPITSIISRIQAEDSGSEDGFDQQIHPPPSHTGGKWRPTIPASASTIDDSIGKRLADDSTTKRLANTSVYH